MEEKTDLMGGVKKQFYSLSMKKKLMITFLLISLVPIICIGLFSYSLSYQNILTQKNVESRNTLRNVNEYIEERIFDPAEYITISFSLKKEVRSLLSIDRRELSEKQSVGLTYDLKKQIVASIGQQGIEDIAIYGQNGLLISGYNTLNFNLSELMQKPEFQQFMTSNKSGFTGMISESKNIYQYICRKVYSVDNRHIAGYVILWLRADYLQTVYQRYNSDYSGYLITTDRAGAILAASENIVEAGRSITQALPGVSPSYSGKNKITLADGEPYSFYSYENPDGQYCLYHFVPLSHITSETGKILAVTLGMMFAMGVLSLMLAVLFSRYFTVPIMRLAGSMVKATTGNVRIDFIPKYDDEVGYLARCYNQMAEKLNAQAAELAHTQEEMRKAEMRAFEAQIKPHFLYNTLTTVIWLIENRESEKAIEVVSALSRLFRISISRGKNIIPIEKEKEHIQSYLSIQKVRYEEEFCWEMNFEEELLNKNTVKMILQPLVENAIYHSMKIREGGKIVINCFRREDTIVMQVKDNGGFMTSEQAKEINRHLWEGIKAEKETGIGIKNVHDRIHLTYHKHYGLRYKIEEGWTIAEITIPYEEEEGTA